LGSDIPLVSGVEPDTSSAALRARCYYLPPHVYACRTDEGLIFLDAKRDRYFGLGGAGITALPASIENWGGGNPNAHNGNEPPVSPIEVQRVANNLVERGLLRRCGSRELPVRRSSAPPLAMDLPQEATQAHQPLHCVDFFYFAIACAQAFWLLKRLPLEAIASRVTAARREDRSHDLLEIFERVQVFRRLRRLFFSEKNRCLLSALALVLFLRRYRHFPLFVIGVKTRPFAAHSWVQYEQFLLEGDPASVCHFVPILVA
jgi:hypothetical protein